MKQTLSEMIREVSDEICDCYCKYAEMYNTSHDMNDEEKYEELIKEHCEVCPLCRLGVFD